MFDFLSDVTKTVIAAPINLGISAFNLGLDVTKVIVPPLDTENAKLKHIKIDKDDKDND